MYCMYDASSVINERETWIMYAQPLLATNIKWLYEPVNAITLLSLTLKRFDEVMGKTAHTLSKDWSLGILKTPPLMLWGNEIQCNLSGWSRLRRLPHINSRPFSIYHRIPCKLNLSGTTTCLERSRFCIEGGHSWQVSLCAPITNESS